MIRALTLPVRFVEHVTCSPYLDILTSHDTIFFEENFTFDRMTQLGYFLLHAASMGKGALENTGIP